MAMKAFRVRASGIKVIVGDLAKKLQDMKKVQTHKVTQQHTDNVNKI